MMRTTILLFLVLLLVSPCFAFRGEPNRQWQTRELSDLPGMSPAGSKQMLGSVEVDGVRAVAYLNNVRAQLAHYGQKQTHHLMVSFQETDSGERLATGTARVRVVGSQQQPPETVTLLPMDSGFGGDISLAQPGGYRLEIATTLADGIRRIFHYRFDQ